ncbi:cell surface A33 antigen-like [Conger conger]|uniref:cell surface A33 antigen-like n=1 Tax=Conger conger TaxID=82655 RepID=UPI002A5AD853|nr:cell surface A33 antigen-like [Conger conger]
MAVGVISFILVLLLVIPSVSPPVLSATDSSLSIVEGRFGDSVTLPCDGSARRLPDDQLDVLWKTDQNTVAHYSGGELVVVGSHFSGRVTFPKERILRRDFSIDISSVKSSDEGKYECVVNKDYLKDVQLKVLPPRFSRSLSVAVNDSVTLPCYGGVNKYEPDKLFVKWERGGDLVLKISSEGLTYGPKYEGRVFVSPDWKDGNFSLSLSVTGLCDSGVYQCSTDQKHNVTSVLLELKDYEHFQSVSLSLGKPFSLSLPEKPVKVTFSKGGTFPKVSLCSTDTELRCEPKYKNRMEWKSNTLTMLNVTSDDVGTYTVTFLENCVISRAYKVNIIPSVNSQTYVFDLISTLLFFILLAAGVGAYVYVRKINICGSFLSCWQRNKDDSPPLQDKNSLRSQFNC